MKCSFAKFITELFFVSEIHFYLFSQGCSDDLYGDSGEFSSPGYPDTPCLLYTSPSPRDATLSRMPSSA